MRKPTSRGGRFLRKMGERVLFATLSSVLLLWIADLAVFDYRASHGTAHGIVTINRYLAVPLKNGHQQFDPQGANAQSCARAIFPHGSDLPCWYLRRNPDQRSDL